MSATFSITRDQLIKASMQICGAIAASEAPSTTDLTDCSLMLGAMLKYWNTNGFEAWCYQTLNWPCVANQSQYTIGEVGANVTNTRPLRIAQAWTVSSSGDIQPLVRQTRDEFNRLSPRLSPGPSNTFYYDQQIPLGIFNPWPVPNNTERTFYASIQRPINDITTGAGTFDIPQEGYLALIWGLAELIMPSYGTEENTQRRIEKNAPKFLQVFTDFWDEDGSVYFQPGMRGR